MLRWMRRLAPLVVVSALGLVVGCQRSDELYCCTTQAACDRPGGSGVITPCTSPDRPVCDNDGMYGPTGRTCVPDPNQSTCHVPGDCNAEAPFCVGGTCRPCDHDAMMGCAATAPVCTTMDQCSGCGTEADCSPFASAGTPHCGSGGACQECRDSNDCAAGSTKPVCDAGSCVPCTDDGQCASGLCNMGSGACVAETDIVYVATTGQAGSCTKAQPCATFAQGLAAVGASRTNMLVAAGSYSETVSVPDKTVAIVARGAQLQPSSLGQPAMVVTDNGHVSVVGLVIHDAGGGVNADGVRCTLVTSGAPSVSLSEVTIKNCAGKGINATSCTVSLDRSTVATNTGGGIVLSGSAFTLVNSFIVNNGGTTSTAGGISIQSIGAAGTHVLDFNTIAQNSAQSGTNSGVDCLAVGVPLAFSDSIVYANPVLGGGKQVGGNNCTWSYSDIGDSISGTGNINQDPKFAAPLTGDFHLMSGSPAINAADPAASVNVDFDGDARPQGPHDDMGADEVKP